MNNLKSSFTFDNHNAVLCCATLAIDKYYAGGLEWINTTLGQSWLRTPEFTKALTDAQSSRLPDVDKIRAATNLITDNVLLIPFCEYPTAAAFRPYVMNAGFFERGTEIQWNSEATWLNK